MAPIGGTAAPSPRWVTPAEPPPVALDSPPDLPEVSPTRPRLAELGAWWVFVTGLAMGIGFSATDHHLRATVMLSGSCLLAAFLRVFLPAGQAGGLVVRRRWVDVALLVVLGIAVGVIGRTMNLHPHL